jgi:hypothetical protein
LNEFGEFRNGMVGVYPGLFFEECGSYWKEGG